MMPPKTEGTGAALRLALHAPMCLADVVSQGRFNAPWSRGPSVLKGRSSGRYRQTRRAGPPLAREPKSELQYARIVGARDRGPEQIVRDRDRIQIRRTQDK
jgi:hypothetical protein